MTRVDWPEYYRRLAVRQQRRAHVEAEVGYTAAPIRLWHFDVQTGDADPTGARLATDTRIRIRGRK